MIPKAPKHRRIKPKRFASKRHREYVAGKPCAIPGGRAGRTGDQWVVPLCRGHHQDYSDSVHQLGGEAQFRAVHGVDLIAYAQKLKETSPCQKTRNL